MDEAMDKLRDEMAKESGRPEIRILGEYLTERLMREPGIAEKIMAEGKTIDGAFAHMRTQAKARAKGGSYVMASEEALKMLCEYYGIPAAAEAPEEPKAAPAPKKQAAGSLDLDALLGV